VASRGTSDDHAGDGVPDGGSADVPDPWGRPVAAFEAVYDQIDTACRGLVAWLENEALPAWQRARQ
jgi:protein-tyrosine-phosphatase